MRARSHPPLPDALSIAAATLLTSGRHRFMVPAPASTTGFESLPRFSVDRKVSSIANLANRAHLVHLISRLKLYRPWFVLLRRAGTVFASIASSGRASTQS